MQTKKNPQSIIKLIIIFMFLLKHQIKPVATHGLYLVLYKNWPVHAVVFS